MNIIQYDAGDLLTMSETPEGFLKGKARVTRTGVFPYVYADGTIKRQLRKPEEVFNKDSLLSMAMIPITNNHPTQRLVTKDDAKQLSIGFTGENVEVDGAFVIVPISITDAAGIAAVKAGRRQLSLGYEVSLEPEAGTFNGDAYDLVQKNIRYNHLAIVDKARAGAACAVNIDGEDAIQVLLDKNYSLFKEDRMIKVQLDGIEYDAAPEVKNALDKVKAQLDSFEAKATAAITEADKAKAIADSVTAELEVIKKRDIAGEIKSAVKSRVSLVSAATSVLDAETIEKIEAMDDKEIRLAVIAKQFPEVKLDGKSDDYISAMYDSAVVLLVAANKAAGANRAASSSANNDAAPVDSRKAYIDRTVNAWKTPEAK